MTRRAPPPLPKKSFNPGVTFFLLLCVFVISSVFTKGPQTDTVNVFSVAVQLRGVSECEERINFLAQTGL